MDDLRFRLLFNSTSVKSAQKEDDNERLPAMEPSLRLKKNPPAKPSEPATFYNDYPTCSKRPWRLEHVG